MVLSIIFLEDKHKILLHLSIFCEYQQFFQHRICFSIQPPDYSDPWPRLARFTSFFLIILFKGILYTKIVICSYPILLLFSVLTFIKWRLTPSYAAKDTIVWHKRPKTIVIRIIVLDDNIQIYSYGLLCEPVLSMRTV